MPAEKPLFISDQLRQDLDAAAATHGLPTEVLVDHILRDFLRHEKVGDLAGRQHASTGSSFTTWRDTVSFDLPHTPVGDQNN